MVNVNPTIIHGISNCMYVCSAIKLAPSRELARDAPCQLGDWGAMFLVGCCSPSCFAAEEQDVLRQFSTGRHSIFNIIDRSFHYWSLADLIQAMPVKGVGGHEISVSFFPRAETLILIIGL